MAVLADLRASLATGPGSPETGNEPRTEPRRPVFETVEHDLVAERFP
jgi:hypothetical protein